MIKKDVELRPQVDVQQVLIQAITQSHFTSLPALLYPAETGVIGAEKVPHYRSLILEL